MRPGARLTAAMLTVLSLASIAPIGADEAGTPSTRSVSDAAVSAVPEPYGPDEFPPWLPKLRRFEIVSLGAFPILLFYTRFAFDAKRFVDSGFDDDGFDMTFAPWPFKNEDSYEPTDDEQLTNVAVAGVLSLAFGVADLLLMGSRASR